MLRTVRPLAPLLFVLLVPSVALADEEPSAADVAAARSLGQEGVKLADANNCAEAIDRLARAEKIFHAPTTLARLGECQVQVGKLVDGTENLNRVARETLPASAPPAFAQAQERARRVLAEAKPRLARLKIAVAAPADAELTVKVDGENVPLANLNTNRPMDPGEHTVEATAPGYLRAVAKVKLAEGGIDSIALTVEPDPNAPKAAPLATGGGAAERSASPQGSKGNPSTVIGITALSVGVVGIGVGAVAGALALGKKSDLDGVCTAEKQCPTNQQDTVDSGKTWGTISTIGFVVGGVGVLTGAYFLLLAPRPKVSASASAASGVQIEPRIGLGSIGLSGSFF